MCDTIPDASDIVQVEVTRFRDEPYAIKIVMTDPVHPAIRRCAAGELSAMQAADQLGLRATVADVIVMLRQAGLQPPEPPPEQMRAKLAHARRVLGLDRA